MFKVSTKNVPLKSSKSGFPIKYTLFLNGGVKLISNAYDASITSIENLLLNFLILSYAILYSPLSLDNIYDKLISLSNDFIIITSPFLTLIPYSGNIFAI